MKSLLDKDFAYTPAIDTDLKKKFAKIVRERKKQEQEAARSSSDMPETNVRVIR